MSTNTSNAVGNRLFEATSNRAARIGVLGPGDMPPASGAGNGYFDYRGVLNLVHPPYELQRAEFPLGRLLHPRKGAQEPIGLPAHILDRNVAVVGPPNSGKTFGLVVPWIIAGLRSGYSVVSIDVKGNLLQEVRDAVTASGKPLGVKTKSLDYTQPIRSDSWNWVAEIDSDTAVDNAIQSILGRHAPPNTDPYFFQQDSLILRGLLEIARDSPKRGSITSATVLRTIRDRDVLERTINRYPSFSGSRRLVHLLSLDDSDYSKRVSGVVGKLDVLVRPTLAKVTSRSDFFTDDILNEHTFATVVAPIRDGQLAETLSSLFFSRLLYHAYDRFNSISRPRPLLLVLDEAPQLANRMDLANVLSLARAAGIVVVLALQDISQFVNENERNTIFSNCGTVITIGNVSDLTAEFVEKRLGQHPVTVRSSTRGANGASGSGMSYTSTNQLVPVLGRREIMHPPFGERPAMVHSRDLFQRSAPFFVETQQS
ncbi:type IV secretory system conjugative DNA transfer family protein [Glutamicibacter ardleyensis]|uniref:type IV secretory system conjugative DNA transfer family protein n=1 Tax=Glutamicibacter ardleyensis TaxID=225894 RepID=UPI003FD28E20